VTGEVVAVLEVELLLPTLLDGAGGGVTAARGVAQDGGAELLVDQDAAVLPRNAAGDSGLEAS
jgi:hypothetical protein